MKSLFTPNEEHMEKALLLAGLEANGNVDSTGNTELMSIKVLFAETHEEMRKGELDVVKLVFPKKDARKIAAQILAAADPPQVV